jgi:hypothetical protein
LQVRQKEKAQQGQYGNSPVDRIDQGSPSGIKILGKGLNSLKNIEIK